MFADNPKDRPDNKVFMEAEKDDDCSCSWSPAFLLDTDACLLQHDAEFIPLSRLASHAFALHCRRCYRCRRWKIPFPPLRSRRQIGPSVPENVSVFPELVLQQRRIAFSVSNSCAFTHAMWYPGRGGRTRSNGKWSKEVAIMDNGLIGKRSNWIML